MIEMLKAVVLVAAMAPAASPGATPDEREAMRHYRTGQHALANERYEEAVAEFQAATKLDPILVPAHYGLGQAHMALKQYPDAVRAFTRCEEAFHQEVANSLTDRMAAERRIDDYIKALEDDLRFLQRMANGTNSDAARAEQAAGIKEEQIRSLRGRRNRTTEGPEPTPAWLSLALGSAYFRNSDLAHAEQSYAKALQVDASLGEAHNNLAVVYLLTGRVAQAETEVQSAEKSGFKVNPQLKKDIAARKQAP